MRRVIVGPSAPPRARQGGWRPSQQPRALLEIGEQRPIEWRARIDPHVVDTSLAAVAAVELAPRLELLAVAARDLPRLGRQTLAALEIDESRRVGVRELDLVGVEQ